MAGKILDLLQVKVKAAEKAKELLTARLAQENFFPQKDLREGPLPVTGTSRPASECGGDWWGHFATDDGKHFVILADATGHGAPAALVTAMAFAACAALAREFRKPEVHCDSTIGLLTEINNLLLQAATRGCTMTALAALIDPRSGTIKLACAGHPPPYALRKPDKAMAAPEPAIKIRSTGNFLGMVENLAIREKTITMQAGERLVLYTDGLIECKSPDGTPYGKAKLETSLARLARANDTELCNGILDGALAHFGKQPTDDDVTVVVVEWSPVTARASA